MTHNEIFLGWLEKIPLIKVTTKGLILIFILRENNRKKSGERSTPIKIRSNVTLRSLN